MRGLQAIAVESDVGNRRRAVVSPEDTAISAGGGVAYALLQKAGQFNILNELAKLAPVDHGDVAVTSGGELPVHYIFHAAAMMIRRDATYLIAKADVFRTMSRVLELADALDVKVLWVPLLGAGVGSVPATGSLAARGLAPGP